MMSQSVQLHRLEETSVSSKSLNLKERERERREHVNSMVTFFWADCLSLLIYSEKLFKCLQFQLFSMIINCNLKHCLRE